MGRGGARARSAIRAVAPQLPPGHRRSQIVAAPLHLRPILGPPGAKDCAGPILSHGTGLACGGIRSSTRVVSYPTRRGAREEAGRRFSPRMDGRHRK